MSVTIDLQGGLGNQLFQIFALLSIAKSQKLDYVIIEKDFSEGGRRTYWKDFFKNINLINKNLQKTYSIFQEKDDNIYQSIPKFLKDTKLVGYFQCEKYLEPIRLEIFDYISLSEKDNLKINKIYLELKNKNKTLIFVHIRRGDYLRLSHYHYNLPLTYYEEALNKFDINNTHFVFFSDDLEYCKNQFNNVPHKSFIDLEDYLSLYLMSSLDGGIIANSTFSWWGAYLLELRKELSGGKIPTIIQSDRWLTNSPNLPNDRIVNRKNWITLKT